MTNNIQDFLGVHLTEIQTAVALALSAGGTIGELKEPASAGRKYYIRHPKHKEDIAIANTTVRSLIKKGVIDGDHRFVQSRWCD